jgi:WD40 repeat protein
VGGPGKVFILDVGKQAVANTLETAAPVDGLAFSPDGKWLVVATHLTSPEVGKTLGEAELVVFAVPKFTAKLKAKSGLWKTADGRDIPREFVDIAWAPDGKSLHAIDAMLQKQMPRIRRWTAPEFVEQPAISIDPIRPAMGLAVAPDGRTLAIVAQGGFGPGVLDLRDLEKGTKIASIDDIPNGYLRAAFTSDGKTVGVFSGNHGMPILEDVFDADGKQKRKYQRMSWWDVGTGKPASPDNPRFAVQAAAQAESRHYSISPDSRIWAVGETWRRATDDRVTRIFLAQTDAAKTWTWEVGTENYPSLAFSPDGTKLAGTLKMPTGWTIAIWAVP